MYRIIGADGREYGPIPADTLRQWIAEGRANGETRARADDSADWRQLRTFPEFSLMFGSRSFPPPPTAPIEPPAIGSARKNNSNAVIGLVLAIIAWTAGLCCCYGFPFSVLGLIFSLIGLSQINQEPDRYDGRGIAIAGIIVSGLNLVFALGLGLFAGTLHAWGNFGPHRFRL